MTELSGGSGRPPVAGPVLVVGAGLMGSSVGLALRRAGVEVQLDDADPAVLAEAVARGAGEVRGSASPAPRIVVVAVPPSAVGAALAAVSRDWPAATVTDVTSVKARPLAGALALGADPVRLVGGHPMAGREVSGPAAARADLLDDRVWVLAPLDATAPERLADARALALTCGAVPVVMTPEDHDRAVALTSHGPQVMASLLAARLVDAAEGDVEVSGQGLRDVTRIAGSDPSLWREILAANAGPVADVLEGVAGDLDRVTHALRSLADGTDTDASGVVEDTLRRGRAGRARVPGKHGARAADYAGVPVQVADAPGELARLFTAAGDAGVNLEDVRIEHVLGRPSGLVELSVRPEDGARLAESLRARGFDVRV